MKTTFKWMFAAILLCGLTFSSCQKDPVPTPEPDPEPQTVTRLSTEIHKVNAGMMGMVTTSNFTWENGVMTSASDSIDMGILSQAFKSNMIYEDGLLVRVDEENDNWNYLYTYEDGLMKSFIHISEGDTTTWGEIVSYTTDGLVEEYISYTTVSSTIKKSRWTLTWENGDAIKVVEEVLGPEELVATNTSEYTYDDKPNVYTGNPLGNAIFDGNGGMVARRQSKHNMFREDYTYTYNDNGYLISCVKENDSTFYNYIEQIVR